MDKTLLSQFHRVALAVSGGKDSMTLLYECARSFPHAFFYVVNIEHGIRGAESVGDSEFVEDYCHTLGVECVRYNVDAVKYSQEHGYTLEQGARLLRREIFRGEVESGRCERVAVAHHLDDNVESVLMHIFRGSGMRGIKGMERDDGLLLRPLLDMTRSDIDSFVEEHNIPYREDSTNSNTAYRRNYIRHEIMPLLTSRYPTIRDSIMRLASSAREDETYLETLAKSHVRCDGDRMLVDADIDVPILKRAIYMAFKSLGVTADVEERHYSLLVELTHSRSGTTLDMPYGVVATLEYGVIALYRPRESRVEERILTIGDNDCGDYIVRIEPHIGDIESKWQDGYRVLYVDGDLIEGATIRAREAGDIFERYGGGTKSLKDYFIDKKVPKAKRNIPIIVRGHEVLAVAGIEISDKVKVSGNTRTIYTIQLRRKDI